MALTNSIVNVTDRFISRQRIVSKLSTISLAYWSRAMTNLAAPENPIVAVCQMTSTEDIEVNLKKCQHLIAKSKRLGAVMTFLPECFDFVGASSADSWRLSSSLHDSHFLNAIRHSAKTHSLWVSLGGMHRRPTAEKEDTVAETATTAAATTAAAANASTAEGVGAEESGKVFNSHVIIDDRGEIRSLYDKIHLFSVDIKGGPRLDEHSFSMPGRGLTPPVTSTPVGVVGLQICYDLRFPEAAIALTQAGAEMLTYPSAFTRPTGEAHWESLLRARAIENQVFVVAAAQVGSHNAKRSSHGHAMVIDPWGRVLVQCEDEDDVKVASVDLHQLRKLRREMPVWRHRREDVYGKIRAHFLDDDDIEIADKKSVTKLWDCDAHNDAAASETLSNGAVTRKAFAPSIPNSSPSIPTLGSSSTSSSSTFRFGPHVTLSAGVVFHETGLSFAFVNRKPVLPGHVLVAPKRCVTRIKELTPPEVSDLFLLSQRVSSVVESHFDASAVTLCVQDGAAAGQTVTHVHAHVLPRREGDFEKNDDVYEALDKHDKGEEEEKGWRSREEMEEEAATLRRLF